METRALVIDLASKMKSRLQERFVITMIAVQSRWRRNKRMAARGKHLPDFRNNTQKIMPNGLRPSRRH